MQKLINAVKDSELQPNNTLTLREIKAQQYIVDSFTGKMPSLIPFATCNKSVCKIASYLLKYTKGSTKTLYQYTYGIYRFSKWLGKSPDEIIQEATADKNVLDSYVVKIDDFIGDLQAEGLAPGTINNHVKGTRALFRANSLNIILPFRVPKTIKYPDRAPTPEELTKVMDIADLREKIIVSLLALSGVRVGTLVNLQYRHVKHDLENGIIPVHMHIEAEITKGKYGEYDTFISAEGVEYLKAYLKMRKIGNEHLDYGNVRGTPPEQINDNSPLIRNEHKATVEPITPGSVHATIHRLYLKAGLIENKTKVRYELRAHSIRKYFRTQLGAISSIPTDYIEFMMGHRISTYNDVKMKGRDYLRNIYASSGLSIRPKTVLSKLDQLKTLVRSLGLNPEEVLSKDALVMPHRTVIEGEQRKVDVLNQALKSAIMMELKQQSSIQQSV
jgi:integrase